MAENYKCCEYDNNYSEMPANVHTQCEMFPHFHCTDVTNGWLGYQPAGGQRGYGRINFQGSRARGRGAPAGNTAIEVILLLRRTLELGMNVMKFLESNQNKRKNKAGGKGGLSKRGRDVGGASKESGGTQPSQKQGDPANGGNVEAGERDVRNEMPKDKGLKATFRNKFYTLRQSARDLVRK